MPFSTKSLLNDSKRSLEGVASERFGSAVESFKKGGLGGLLRGSGSSDAKGAEANKKLRKDGSWYSTSYAAALAGPTNYRPKLKFLFKVEFIFTEAAKSMFKGINSNDFTFMIKFVDRPKIDFEYEEDINMYNFRTKVLKKIRHRDLTVTFMDDAGNRVFNFFRYLMMIHSPITRRQIDRDNTLTPPMPTSLNNGSGMLFSGNTNDSAHRAAVNSDFGNSIAAIRVKQIFIDPQSALATATRMVSFDFINPRIISFDLDELSHEASEANLLTMVFDYDWMEMVDVGALGTASKPYTSDFENVIPPGVHGAPPDISPNYAKNAPEGAQGGKSNGKGGFIDAATGALTGVLKTQGQKLTGDLIGKAVTSVAGNGRFAKKAAGYLTSNLSDMGGPVANLVYAKARDGVGGMWSSISNPNARATTRTITDSSTAGADSPIAVVSASNAYSNSNPSEA